MAQAHKRKGKRRPKPSGSGYKPKKTYGGGDEVRLTAKGRPITKTKGLGR